MISAPRVSRVPFAVFSPCSRYRYMLGWPTGIDNDLYALFALANPSTATAEQPDPTVTRCINYSKRWGYGWCHVVNARAWRETDPNLVPHDPLAISEPKDPSLNDDTIQAQAMGAAVVICGWGKLAGDARAAQILAYLKAAGVKPYVLALNNDGTPRHPLARGKMALRASAQPIEWEGRE